MIFSFELVYFCLLLAILSLSIPYLLWLAAFFLKYIPLSLLFIPIWEDDNDDCEEDKEEEEEELPVKLLLLVLFA